MGVPPVTIETEKVSLFQVQLPTLFALRSLVRISALAKEDAFAQAK